MKPRIVADVFETMGNRWEDAEALLSRVDKKATSLFNASALYSLNCTIISVKEHSS